MGLGHHHSYKHQSGKLKEQKQSLQNNLTLLTCFIKILMNSVQH
jgi:hypothetical protein